MLILYRLSTSYVRSAFKLTFRPLQNTIVDIQRSIFVTQCATSTRQFSSSVKVLNKYTMYPAIEPFNFGYLDVSAVHKVYYEQCGNKDGLPVIFVHGYVIRKCS